MQHLCSSRSHGAIDEYRVLTGGAAIAGRVDLRQAGRNSAISLAHACICMHTGCFFPLPLVFSFNWGCLSGIDAEVNHDVDWPTADIALFTRTL